MLKEYKKTSTTPLISKFLLSIQKMKSELVEHRYYLEQNVERRTGHLLKRIAMLESCNAILCDRLALAQKESAALMRQHAFALPKKDTDPNDRSTELYAMNIRTQNLIDSNAQEIWL